MARSVEPIPPGRLTVLPATIERWPDVITLLGGDDERGCWCQSWRGVIRAPDEAPGGEGSPEGGQGRNRRRLYARVDRGPVAPLLTDAHSAGLPRWLMRLEL